MVMKNVSIVVAYGTTIRTSNTVLKKVRELCIKLESAYHAKRDKSPALYDALKKEAQEHPEHFTGNALTILGVK